MLASYTFSKFIDDVEGNNGWANSGPTSIRNYYNLAAEESVDGADIPQSLVISSSTSSLSERVSPLAPT
jgi:hypothetical protein